MSFLSKYRRFDLQKDQDNKSEVPKALEIQKRRFLCALGKESPCSPEEENFVRKTDENLNPLGPFTGLHLESGGSRQSSDSFARKTVKKILEKHGHFDLHFYLDCVNAICHTYSGNIVSGFYDALTYVLTHAMQFGDQSKNIFLLEPSTDTPSSKFALIFPIVDRLPEGEYMSEVSELIHNLKCKYDETKYRKLNNNVTYLILLLLRRLVKSPRKFSEALSGMKIHQEYEKLCPDAISSRLPMIGKHFNIHLPEKRLHAAACLAIHAFLTVFDKKTSKILQKTCIQHLEWRSLQLPYLFFRVVALYRMSEADLWDDLCFDITYPSLMKLGDTYYAQYKMLMSEPLETSRWFPFCKFLKESYHTDLSAQENQQICMILSYLIDLKLGFENSCARVAYWARNCVFKEAALETATEIYEKYTE